MSIKESALNAITSIAQSDYIRAVTSAGASRRVTVANLAKAIIESYTGSSLAGENQSVKSALDALNSKSTSVVTFGSFSDFSDALKAMCNSLYDGTSYATTFGAVFTGAAAGTYIVSAVVTATAIRFIASYSQVAFVGQHVRSSDEISIYRVTTTAV